MSIETGVVVIGAGLAGLAAAITLAEDGREVVVLEAGDAVGGRVRSDLVDGVVLDRGFQVYNAGYPAARDFLDQDALRLRPFLPGAVISDSTGHHLVADPRREPRLIPATLRAPIGSLPRKAALGAYAAGLAAAPAKVLRARQSRLFPQALAAHGVDGPILERFLRPFLAGVFLDGDLGVPSRYGELVLRSFARGTIGVPATGMRTIPDQLAAQLPQGTIRLASPVAEVKPGTATCADGTAVSAPAIVVATDGATAHRLLGDRLPAPPTRGCTTYYHLADEPPVPHAALVLDAEARGPVINTVVLTNAAPEYAPGQVLVSSTVLGADPPDEAAVLAHLALLYRCGTERWEHVRTYRIPDALPVTGDALRLPVRLGDGLFVCGDHRDTPSIQGALVSGRRAARAVLGQS